MSSQSIVSYPHYDDPDFASKLYSKMEVRMLYDKDNYDVVHYNYYRHQAFVRMICNPLTPYDRMLLYHSTGSGKTFVIFGLIDVMRRMYSQKAIILVRNEATASDIMTKLLKWLKNHPDIDKPKDGDYTRLRNDYLAHHMEITTFGKLRIDLSSATAIKRGTTIKKYSNRLIIIDEIHNITTNKSNTDSRNVKQTYKQMALLLGNVVGSRIIGMSATPMINVCNEIVSLAMLLNQSQEAKDYVARYNLQTGGTLNQLEEFTRRFMNRRVSFYHMNERSQEVIHMGTSKVEGLNEEVWYTQIAMGSVQNAYYRHYIANNESDDYKVKDLHRSEISISLIVIPHGLSDPNNIANLPYNMILSPDDIKIDGSVKAGSQRLVDLFQEDKIRSGTREVTIQRLVPKFKHILTRIIDKGMDVFAAFSPKLAHMISTIEYPTGPDGVFNERFKGSAVVYYEAINKIGINLIAEILEIVGYERYVGSEDLTSAPDRKRFAYITGGESSSLNDTIRDQFNSPANKYGDKIRILLITNHSSEGVAFHNVKTVILLQSKWNFTRSHQIYSRCIRADSHDDLPPDHRVVRVFRYACISWTEANGEQILDLDRSIDLIQLKRSFDKHQNIERIQEVLKEISIDREFNVDPELGRMMISRSNTVDRSTYPLYSLVTSGVRLFQNVRLAVLGIYPTQRFCRMVYDVVSAIEDFSITKSQLMALYTMCCAKSTVKSVKFEIAFDILLNCGFILNSVHYYLVHDHDQVYCLMTKSLSNMWSAVILDNTGYTQISQVALVLDTTIDNIIPAVYHMTCNNIGLPHGGTTYYLRQLNNALYFTDDPHSTTMCRIHLESTRSKARIYYAPESSVPDEDLVRTVSTQKDLKLTRHISHYQRVSKLMGMTDRERTMSLLCRKIVSKSVDSEVAGATNTCVMIEIILEKYLTAVEQNNMTPELQSLADYFGSQWVMMTGSELNYCDDNNYRMIYITRRRIRNEADYSINNLSDQSSPRIDVLMEYTTQSGEWRSTTQSMERIREAIVKKQHAREMAIYGHLDIQTPQDAEDDTIRISCLFIVTIGDIKIRVLNPKTPDVLQWRGRNISSTKSDGLIFRDRLCLICKHIRLTPEQMDDMVDGLNRVLHISELTVDMLQRYRDESSNEWAEVLIDYVPNKTLPKRPNVKLAFVANWLTEFIVKIGFYHMV
ncbi:hypothetical protein HDU86_000567 [Geranomyces michiganensis]|nr:hypothetical protein HDU86_000567 [Geranomyces michiganensis]